MAALASTCGAAHSVDVPGILVPMQSISGMKAELRAKGSIVPGGASRGLPVLRTAAPQWRLEGCEMGPMCYTTPRPRDFIAIMPCLLRDGG